jgi:hypothetical protein
MYKRNMLLYMATADRSVAVASYPQLVAEVQCNRRHFTAIDRAVIVEAIVAVILDSGIAIIARLAQQRWCAGAGTLLAERREALLCRCRAARVGRLDRIRAQIFRL